jgi:hypothetical protein
MVNLNRILTLLAFCYLQACSLDFDKYQDFTTPRKTTVKKDMEIVISNEDMEIDALILDMKVITVVDQDDDGLNDDVDN